MMNYWFSMWNEAAWDETGKRAIPLPRVSDAREERLARAYA